MLALERKIGNIQKMGDSKDEEKEANYSKPPSQRLVAEQLALELGGAAHEPEILIEMDRILTRQQMGLVSDAYGLIHAMSFEPPRITTGQPRIQRNLQSVITQLSDDSQDEKKGALIVALDSIITRAAEAGLTAENQPLGERLKHRIR